uniref:Teneurin-3 n=1 Tax=Magallana gigas TaxID=29159 RepID=K1QSX6_MAGGI
MCLDTCPKNCDGNTCKRESGNCLVCKKDWFGDSCTCKGPCGEDGCNDAGICKTCVHGRYGELCIQTCAPSCAQCDRESGECKVCVPGKFGALCSKTCQPNCKDSTCDKTTGLCVECAPGKFDEMCDKNCSLNCHDAFSCSRDGHCHNGCKLGYQPPVCAEPLRQIGMQMMVIVTVLVIGFLFMVVIVVICICYVR